MFGSLLCLYVLMTGCPSTPQPQPPKVDEDAGTIDAGVDAALNDGSTADGTIPDAASPDGTVDASVADGSTDDASTTDASNVDASTTDASLDGGTDASTGDAGMGTGDAGPRTPVCDPGFACGAGSPCADGEVCIVNACGLSVCQTRSANCGTSMECAPGSACVPTSIGDVCTPVNGEVCNASTDCPVNHTCEGALGARSCVLRRIPCFDEFDCGLSYMCLGVTGDSASCQYAYRPCDTPGTCALSVCADIDGNGSTECGAGGFCNGNADCSSPDRCVNLHFTTECGQGGLCNQSGGTACGARWECLDLQGDGYGECVPQGGTCTSHADCPGGGRCTVPLDRSPPRCVYPM